VIRLRAWQPDNLCLILNRRRECLPAHKLWGPANFLLYRYRWLFSWEVKSSISWDVKAITHIHILPKLRMHGATPSLPHVFIWFSSPNTNKKTVQNASGTTSTKTALLTLTATERGDNGVQALTRVSHWLEHWETKTSELVNSGTS
jgi:hypothetical protein